MWNKLLSYFIPEDKRDAPEVLRRYKLVVTIIFLTALFDLNYAGLTLFLGMREGTYMMLFTFVVNLILPFFIRARAPLVLITNVYVFFGVAAIDVCIYYSGGFGSPVLPWLASSPIVAMLMAGRATGLVWAVINTATVVVFSVLGQASYPFPVSYNRAWEGLFYTNCYTGLVLIIFFVSLVYENGKNGALRKLAEKSLLLAEEQRKTALHELSQEIHDNIGQTLAIVKMNLHLVDILKDQHTEVRLKDSLDLLGEAIKNLRGISYDLYNDETLEKDLVQVLQTEASVLSKVGVFETSFQLNGAYKPLDKQAEFMLSRVAKEAISNIIRHAGASQICIRLIYEPRQLTLIIQDNGVGMDIEKISTAGLGLKTMFSRVKLIGGDFSIDSVPQKGTSVIVRLPLNER